MKFLKKIFGNQDTQYVSEIDHFMTATTPNTLSESQQHEVDKHDAIHEKRDQG
ncbi:MAG: hypothetical protein DHS20C10_06660 [marine bacterium B5-7]|nr:MAG: hypothetical protein DHS20C10_06660 [marine bacterium B5-7]